MKKILLVFLFVLAGSCIIYAEPIIKDTDFTSIVVEANDDAHYVSRLDKKIEIISNEKSILYDVNGYYTITAINTKSSSITTGSVYGQQVFRDNANDLYVISKHSFVSTDASIQYDSIRKLKNDIVVWENVRAFTANSSPFIFLGLINKKRDIIYLAYVKDTGERVNGRTVYELLLSKISKDGERSEMIR